MIRLSELRLPLDHPPEALREVALARLGLPAAALRRLDIARRGYDARRRDRIVLVYTLDLEVEGEADLLARGLPNLAPAPRPVPPALPAPRRAAPRPVVIGAGPCGLWAALTLARAGWRPIVLERGQPVRQRTRDTFAFWRGGPLDPGSNVQFGEGGAGTFSDGKLWSGVRDPDHLRVRVLADFAEAGAPEEIRIVSKPHIGTFRLVTVVQNLREEITRLGGEYRFGTQVTGLELDRARRLRALHLADGTTLETDHAILAPGHSARDTFVMLHAAGVAMEAKPFSIGVRIEHPQSMIDRARFGRCAGHPLLGAADYRLVAHEAAGRSVYSFCMCPGGTVVAAASEPGRVVTNGMSQYSRAERNANAGLVVAIEPARDYPGGPLAGIELQRHWEERAFATGGGAYAAPGQRVGDFLAGRPSTEWGDILPSYRPGVTPADLAACLPDFVTASLRAALPRLDRDLPGFAHPDAVMTAIETRTSSPLRLLRDASRQSVNTPGLFPAGEGAGHAGGIMSAAIDGIRAAEALTRAACTADAAA